MSALGFLNPAMGPDATVAWRRSLLLPRLLLVPLLWSGLALGALALVSSPHRVLYDLLSEQQLLEVEDLSLTLLQGGRLGPLSLPPDLPDLDPECRELLLDFANSSAELTGCLVRSARPVRLCQTCYPLFQQVANKMDNISRAVGVGRGAHPGPPAWRVGKGGCTLGASVSLFCKKRGLDWDCSLGHQKSEWHYRSWSSEFCLHGCCWASS